jgi:hypothetical protein
MDRQHGVVRPTETRAPSLKYDVKYIGAMLGLHMRRTFFLLQLPLFILEVIKKADSSSHEQRGGGRREYLQDDMESCLFGLLRKTSDAPRRLPCPELLMKLSGEPGHTSCNPKAGHE